MIERLHLCGFTNYSKSTLNQRGFVPHEIEAGIVMMRISNAQRQYKGREERQVARRERGGYLKERKAGRVRSIIDVGVDERLTDFVYNK